MFYKKFKFVKDFQQPEGTFPKGGEVTIMENRVWYNNGMIQNSYAELLMD